MVVETDYDIEALKRIGRIVALTRDKMLSAVRPGITTKELDRIGERLLESYNARSAPIKDYGFPGATCISINDEIAHGIPGHRVIREGDIVNIDVSAELDGYYADTGASVVAGKGTIEKLLLCECAKKAVEEAVAVVRAEAPINNIGRVIFNKAKEYGFQIIRNLSGHGVGKKLHEKPEHILNYYDIWDNETLILGQVIAIETFICARANYVIEDPKGWVLKTPDGSAGAQFEHTVIVTKEQPLVLTAVK
ncbi:MAG: type I methionyl aminopeptidase [Bacillota bacterium]